MATKVNGQDIPEDGKKHKVDVGNDWFMEFRSPGKDGNDYDAFYGEKGQKDHWHTWSDDKGMGNHDPDYNQGKGMLSGSQQEDKDDKKDDKK